MSTDLVPFVFDGREVRTILRDGEPWFVLADACAILEIQNPRDVAKSLPPSNVAKIYVSSAAQGRRMLVINEPGLYRLIFRSSKPEAEKFQDWLYNEVLPSIRKTGQFAIGIPMLTIQPTKWRKEFPPEFYIQLFRLKGKSLPDDLATEPWVAQATANLVYQRLAENLWKAIQAINPVIGKWRKRRLHQHVADGAPKEQLRAFLHQCIGAMGSFMEWRAFYAHWNSRYPIQRDLPEGALLNFADGQLLLPFEEVPPHSASFARRTLVSATLQESFTDTKAKLLRLLLCPGAAAGEVDSAARVLVASWRRRGLLAEALLARAAPYTPASLSVGL
jgi:prophage antirepressor-like protein